VDRLNQILEVAGQTDKNEISILHGAFIKTTTSYKKDPTAARKKDWDSAKEGLSNILNRLHAKYFPESAPSPEGERFVDRKQALNWLTAQGYKVSRSKFYDDCRDGFPAVHRDKSVSRFQVMQYAQQLDIKRRSTNGASGCDTSEDEARKLKADADQSVMKADAMRREMDRKWILRESAEEETCVWVSRLRDAVAYQLDKALLAIIHGCGGKPERQSEVKAILDSAMASACNEIANADEMTVLIEDIEDEAC